MGHIPKPGRGLPVARRASLAKKIANLSKLRERATKLLQRYDDQEWTVMQAMLQAGTMEIQLAGGQWAVVTDNFESDNVAYRVAKVKRLQLMFRKSRRSRVLHDKDPE